MDIQFPQILFQMINFGVVAGALTYLLYKPVKKMLEERSNRIEEAQKAAEITIAEKRNIEEMKKDAKRKADKEAQALMDAAMKDIEAKRKDLLAKAKKEAAGEVEKMKQAAHEENKAMVEAARKEFTDAVVATVEKVVGSFDKKAHAKIIDTELENLLQQI
jgi:F-type H+-transporting ATPase subunit b